MIEKTCIGEPGCPDAVVARLLCRKHYQRWWKTGSTDAPQAMSIEDRFWSQINKDGPVPVHRPGLGPCWVFTGKPLNSGYGRFWDGTFYRPGRPRTVLAHRWSFKTYVEDPGDRMVLHHCDNRLCVRYTTHLFLGDAADNMADRNAKRRHSHGETHGPAKLTEVQVLAIREALSEGATLRGLGREYGVDKSTIMRIRDRKIWSHI